MNTYESQNTYETNRERKQYINDKIRKEIKLWEKENGPVKYSKKYCKENKISKERNKLVTVNG